MFQRLLRPALATVFVTAVVWALVLGWWRAEDHQPQGSEALLHLVLLPLAVIGGFFLLRGLIDHLRSAPAPAAAEAGARAGGASAGAAEPAEDADDGLRLALLAGGLLCPAGEAPAQVLDAVRDGARPPLDEVLADLDGFPLMAGRVAGVDGEALRSEFAELMGGSPPEDEILRALALVAAQLPALAAELPALLDKAGADAVLRVLWIVPHGWPESIRLHVTEWMRTTQLADLPPERVHVTTRPAANGVESLAVMDELTVGLARASAPTLCVVLGAVSHLGETTVRAWQYAGRLLHGEASNGTIPGEAAVALVVAEPSVAQRTGLQAMALLGRVCPAVRSASADAPGRISAQVLGTLIDRALRATSLTPEDVAIVVADADLRASRLGELLAATGERLSELDPMQDCPAVGAACGALEPAGALLALLCAADAAAAARRAALCVSNQHETLRAVIAIAPPPDAETDTGAT